MIRLFLPVPQVYNPKFKDWSYLSLRYLKAFDETELPVKAIAFPVLPGVDLSDENTFGKFAHMFAKEIPEYKINIVMGFGGVFEQYHTENMVNIGLTVSYPRPQRIEEIRALNKYQAIWAGTQNTKKDLLSIGFDDVGLVPPEPVIIKMMLKEYM